MVTRPRMPPDRAFEVGLGFAAVGMLEILDWRTGPYVSFSLLFLLPVTVIAWRVSSTAGTALAIFAVGCEALVDWAWPQVHGAGVYAWNAVSRASVLVFAAMAVARIRADAERIRVASARLAEHLAASETRFGALADGLPDHAIVLLDRGIGATRWNAATLSITGRSDGEIRGEELETLFPSVDVVGSGPRWTVRPDGARYWAEIDAYELGDGRRLAIVRDATARRRAEEEIRRARDEAVAVARELETFSYTVAHDLRAPLRAIDGFGAMLAEDCSDRLGDRGASYVSRMRMAARRMGSLIDKLLEMSSLGRVPLRRSRVDLSELAHDIIGGLARAEPERSVEVAIARGLFADADPRLAGVLLRHLLENAWKFTSGQARARIEVGRTQDGGAFYVRDDGAGFDMAFADRLFRPFERLHGVGEYEGLGMGLAIVRRIVERHGGRVWAEGAVGKGATMYFTLPPDAGEE